MQVNTLTGYTTPEAAAGYHKGAKMLKYKHHLVTSANLSVGLLETP